MFQVFDGVAARDADKTQEAGCGGCGGGRREQQRTPESERRTTTAVGATGDGSGTSDQDRVGSLLGFGLWGRICVLTSSLLTEK